MTTFDAGPAGAGADEDDADGEVGRQGEHLGEQISDERHDRELRECANAHFPRMTRQVAKVFQLDRHAHAEHDQSQEERHLRRDPRQRRGKDGARRADEDDEPDHVLDDETTNVLQEDSSHQKSLPADKTERLKNMQSSCGYAPYAL